jgi:signal recognition particle GTPase
LLVAADNRRPAAIEQLITLGKQLDVPLFSEDPKTASKDIYAHALTEARKIAATHVIVDAAGRLHIDEELMAELEQVKKVIKPNEVLLVVDAMTGQRLDSTGLYYYNARYYNPQIGRFISQVLTLNNRLCYAPKIVMI